MKTLKILRILIESEQPITKSNLSYEEKKYFEIGFDTAKSRINGLIDLLEEEYM